MNLAATTVIPEPPGRQPGYKDDIIMDGFIHLAPRTHDISLTGEHIPSISHLAADLDMAVQAGWSRRHDIRYSNVEVLLLRWADDDLGVLAELKDLQHVFTDLYHYNVRLYDIPSHKPDKALTRRVLDFLEDDREETLFVLYYAGHGKTNQQSNEGAIWFANRQPGSASLPSKGIQSKFEEAYADVLLLYDCCNAAATTASSSYRGHKGVTEVIAACGYESIAPEVGKHSFSNALTETLAAASKGQPISVAELHARVLSRLKCWTPSFVKDKEGRFTQDEAGRLKHEIQPRRTPIYGILCETEPRRSIALGPLKIKYPQSNGCELPSSSTPLANGSIETRPSTTQPDGGSNARKRKRPVRDEPEYPQILLAIRLDKHELDLSAWKECLLRQLPSEAKDIKIEGIYGSFSTLLLLRVPVIVWNLLPQNPAYTFVGFITSDNMAVVNSQPLQAADSMKSKPPSFPYHSEGSTHIREILSVTQPTDSKSNASEALVKSLSLSTHDIQDRILPDVDEPVGDIESPLSAAFRPQKIGSSPPGPRPQPNPNELYPRLFLEKELRTIIRSRQPKVKSGCIPCKVRRVKCDETKPSCLKCQKSGRICDGYPDHPSKVRDSTQVRIPSLGLYQPNPSAITTKEESQYFELFREKIAGKMSGYFNSTFWTGIVLQESHAVPAIRRAVIAIAALYKALETAPTSELKVNIIQSFDNKHHEYAVLQYIKAIQSLSQYISQWNSPQLRPTLIACLLFVCFETISGSYSSAVQQTYGGLKILRSYYAGQPGSQPWLPKQVLPKDSKVQKSGYITQALRDHMGRDPMLKETSILSHIEDYLEDENSLQPTIEPPLADESNNTLLNQHEQHQSIPLRRVTVKSLEKKQYRSQGRSNASYRAGNEQSSHGARDTSQSNSDFNDLLSKHSPQPSQIFSTLETHFSPLPTISEISTPAPQNPSLVLSPSYAPQTEARPASGKSPPVTPDLTPPTLHYDLTIEETIIRTIVRLDGQALFFGTVPGTPPLIWDIHKVYHLPIPTTFSNFESAYSCWDFLMDRALQFCRRTLFNRAYTPQIADSREYIASQYKSHMNELAAFKNAFEPILGAALTPENTVTDPAALVVSLYYRCTIIMLAVVTSDSEMVYDAFLLDFQYIVQTCARLIAQTTTQTPRFIFDVGIVLPLHFTATKCRDSVVRREAIELLWTSPRQEGMWDGMLSARIGKWVMSCEEGLPSFLAPLNVSTRIASGSIAEKSRSAYPSPHRTKEEIGERGHAESMRKAPQTVAEAIERWFEQLSENASSADLIQGTGIEDVGISAEGSNLSIGTPNSKTVEGKVWSVPEENRVRLVVVDFHIPDRYVKVKCQTAVLLGSDGMRTERETIIAW